MDGGTTSDGIVISKPVLVGFNEGNNKTSLQVKNKTNLASVTFNVTVPEGKTASLRYKLLLDIIPMDEDEGIPDGSSVTFTAKLDGNMLMHRPSEAKIWVKTAEIRIPSATHTVVLEATFNARNCYTRGSIDSLTIHVHHFDDVKTAREPICGVAGESHSKCSICGKDTVLTVMPAFSEHKLTTTPAVKSSCLENVGEVSKCEHCPYTVIQHTGKLNNHDFDADNTCKVCGLHMPKSRNNGTIYEISDAGEMRILAEMVSMGKVSGNIGVDIKSDLVFDRVSILPLGTFDHPFQGVLNGNGHRVRGIVNAYQGIDCLGFVGVARGTLLSPAVIANLIFDSGNTLQGTACVGGIVGYAENCRIVNCASFASLQGTDCVGGIAGYAGKTVSILNCGAVSSVRTKGRWNTMACGMPHGQIQNCYGAATNDFEGSYDEMPTATLRHCFSTQGSAEELTKVSQDVMSSRTMVERLSEQSESPCFMMSPDDHYPVPVVDTDIMAKPNSAIPTVQSSGRRLASSPAASGDENEEDDEDTEQIYGYVDESPFARSDRSIEEIFREDSTQNTSTRCTYIVTRNVPEGFRLYDRVSGGDLLAFESYVIAADSSSLKMTEYDLVANGRVKPSRETMAYNSIGSERIDEYIVGDGGARSLVSRISFVNDYDIVCQENIDGILKPVWSIETERDESGRGIATNSYSFDRITGETRLDYTCAISNVGDDNTYDGSYAEYPGADAGTIHGIYNHWDAESGAIVSRSHYILRASDRYPLEIRSEKIINGTPCLDGGIYFIYADDGALLQSVAFGPADDDLSSGRVRLYVYNEYVGTWHGIPYGTDTESTGVKPLPAERLDSSVYDMRGRIVGRSADAPAALRGLPRGLYIWRGAKYLKR